ncbi:family 2 glycosyl transferase [Salinisphaera sp. T31B1]
MDGRLRVVSHERNLGRPAARNTAFATATGEYVAMLDADDCCLPQRLARQVSFLDQHYDIDVVGSWWRGMDAGGRLMPLKRNQRKLDADTVNCLLLFRGIIHNPTVMARRVALTGFEYDSSFPVAQDYDLWARMQQAGHRFAQIPEVLLHYRQHELQASVARAAEARDRRCEIQARLLTSLGMQFSDREVVNHNLLYTGRRLYEARIGKPMDREFVAWAEQWFERLMGANATSGFYPEPAFSSLVSRLWFDCCRKAARPVGQLSVWRRFLGSTAGRYYLRRVWRAAAL